MYIFIVVLIFAGLDSSCTVYAGGELNPAAVGYTQEVMTTERQHHYPGLQGEIHSALRQRNTLQLMKTNKFRDLSFKCSLKKSMKTNFLIQLLNMSRYFKFFARL